MNWSVKVLGVCFLLFSGWSSIGAPVRLGVVPQTPELNPLGDLLTVNLSANDDVSLVERQELERVRQEKSLNAFLGDGALQLGRELNADGLLLLNVVTIGQKTTLQARLIAVKPGVVLTAESFDWPARNITRHPATDPLWITPFIPKLAVPQKDAVPISILNVRSPFQNENSLQLEKDLTLQLINRLSVAPEVFVLERRRMELLTAEKALLPVDESPFWKGSYLVEGIIDKDGFTPGELKLTVRLVPPSGVAQNFSYSGARTNTPLAVEKTSGEILASIGKVTLDQEWNAAAEAERYLTEANWAYRWKLYQKSKYAAESAWALGRRTERVAELRVKSLLRGLPRRFNPLPPDAPKVPGPEMDSYFHDITTALQDFAQLPDVLDPSQQPFHNWQKRGVDALEWGGMFLKYFWETFGVPDGYEGRILRLQQAAQQTESALITASETPLFDSTTALSGRLKELQEARENSSRVGMLRALRLLKKKAAWAWTPPKQAFQEFELLVTSGGLPRNERLALIHGPHYLPWTDGDRIAGPEGLQRLVENLISSTNLEHVILGHLMYIDSYRFENHRLPSEARLHKTLAPTYDALTANLDELMCQDNQLLLHALSILDVQSVLDSRQPESLDAGRRFRTNCVTRWVNEANCLDTNIMAHVFRPLDFETNHLNAVLNQVIRRTGTNQNQIPQFAHGFLTAYLDGHAHYYNTNTVNSHLSVRHLHFNHTVFNTLLGVSSMEKAKVTFFLQRVSRFHDRVDSRHRRLFRPLTESLYARLKEIKEGAVTVSVPGAGEHSVPTLVVSNRWNAIFPQLPEDVVQCDRCGKGHLKWGHDFQLRSVHTGHFEMRDGKLWVDVQFELPRPTGYRGRATIRGSINAVDLNTLNHVYYPYTASNHVGSLRRPTRTFTVLDGSIYRVRDGRLWEISVTRTNGWTALDVPATEKMNLDGINGRLYLSTRESILEYNPATKRTTVMASVRRRPITCYLDARSSLETVHLFEGDDELISVFAAGGMHHWNRKESVWAPPRPALAASLGVVAGNRDRLFLAASDFRADTTAIYRVTQGKKAELLSFGNSNRRSPRRVKPPGEFIWHYKDPKLIPSYSMFYPDGEHFLSVRRASKDDPDRLLFYDEAFEKPAELVLNFVQLQNGPRKPPPALWHSYDHDMKVAPEGVVFASMKLDNLWIIPRKDLKEAVAKEREATKAVRRKQSRIPLTLDLSPRVDGSQFAGASLSDEISLRGIQLLAEYDKDRDLQLNSQELYAAIKKEQALAKYRTSDSRMIARVMLDPYDGDGSRTIELEELLGMLRRPKPKYDWNELMGRFDEDKDGKLSRDERKALYEALSKQ